MFHFSLHILFLHQEDLIPGTIITLPAGKGPFPEGQGHAGEALARRMLEANTRQPHTRAGSGRGFIGTG